MINAYREVGANRKKAVFLMSINTKPYPKPSLLVLLTFFVGFGLVVTSIAEAAEPAHSAESLKVASAQRAPAQHWLRSVRGLDLASKLQNWKPKIHVDTDGEGVKLSHPFGNHGPALRLSASLPEQTHDSLRAGGDNQVGSIGGDLPDAYLFLQKRW